jgi:hypothetical protein
MTPDEYRAALQRLGLNQTTVAPLLGIDARTSRRYARFGVPHQAACLLAYMLEHGTDIAERLARAGR